MEIFGCASQPIKDQAPLMLRPVSTDSLEKSREFTEAQRTWIAQQGFRGELGKLCVLPSPTGSIDQVLFGWNAHATLWDFAKVVQALPINHYRIHMDKVLTCGLFDLAKVWGLSCYEFTRYRSSQRSHPTLVVDELTKKELFMLNQVLNGSYQIRDWINTPAEDFGPLDMSDLCHAMAHRYQATISEVVGDDLLKENYPLIHLVGRASSRAPRMICLRWGNPTDPLIALVGKGVCFDTGGVQVKPHAAMQTMKKDMGGAAHMMALAEMIMAAKLPVSIALWIAAVDNSISDRSFLPGDIVSSRSGKTVEIGHTDAEGRLLLADLLSAAADDQPACMIDYATLTGAQRIALGMELPAVFCNDKKLCDDLIRIGDQHHDPLWQLPLHKPYIPYLESDVADLSSTGKTPYGGSITAALFLQQFVPTSLKWMHIDASCFNQWTSPGRPKGGEAMALEALYGLIQSTFS